MILHCTLYDVVLPISYFSLLIIFEHIYGMDHLICFVALTIFIPLYYIIFVISCQCREWHFTKSVRIYCAFGILVITSFA